MLPNSDGLIIPNYDGISARGGRRANKKRRSIKNRTRKLKRSNKSRTRRTYR